MRTPLLLALLLVTGCSHVGGPYPSLAPRAAEAIDPRIEVVRPVNDRPVTSGLMARLSALVAQARGGDADFAPAASTAERLTASAGARQSESWIAAQEALSAAIAARRPTAMAQADIDGLATDAIQTQGGIAPNDLAAIDRAAAEVKAISSRQTDRIHAMQRRLGS
jgi:hypothetical protein